MFPCGVTVSLQSCHAGMVQLLVKANPSLITMQNTSGDTGELILCHRCKVMRIHCSSRGEAFSGVGSSASYMLQPLCYKILCTSGPFTLAHSDLLLVLYESSLAFCCRSAYDGECISGAKRLTGKRSSDTTDTCAFSLKCPEVRTVCRAELL